jgi:hypothetical protein
MAEEKNIHLVRLNKLYHFLNDRDATVKIYFTDNDERKSTEYKTGRKEFNLKDLFAEGCEVSGRALKDIVGKRSYIESKEIGRSQNITEKQKDVIKSIKYSFKEDVAGASPLKTYSESKKDLFLKKNFSHYTFENIQKVYPSATAEIKGNILDFLKHGFKPAKSLGSNYRTEDYYWMQWDLGHIRKSLRTYDTLELVNQSVINKLFEIRDYWDESMLIAEDLNDAVDQSEFIFPGIKDYSRLFEGSKIESHNINRERANDIFELLLDKGNWIDACKYELIYELLQIHREQELDQFPNHVHALILLISAEVYAIEEWMAKTALDEINNNIVFSVRHSSNYDKVDDFLLNRYTLEELATHLEDYNFEIQPDQIFDVNSSSILNSPLYKYGVQERSDLYDKTEFQYALKVNLFKYFYTELKKHMCFSDELEGDLKDHYINSIRSSVIKEDQC